MREKYDIVEDVRIKEEKYTFGQGFTKTLIIGLIFVIFCCLFFVSAYSYMMDKIKRSNEGSKLVNDSRKSYYLEKRLIQELDKKSSAQ